MKKILLLLALLPIFVLSSCSKDEDEPTIDYTPIIGSWSETMEDSAEYISMTLEIIWSFNTDKSASQRVLVKLNDYTMEDVTNIYSYVYNGKSIIFKTKDNRTFEYDVSVSGNKMKLGNNEDGYFDLTKK